MYQLNPLYELKVLIGGPWKGTGRWINISNKTARKLKDPSAIIMKRDGKLAAKELSKAKSFSSNILKKKYTDRALAEIERAKKERKLFDSILV